MKSKISVMTYTAMMLALLICLQWAGSQIPEPTTKQLITGSLVNCVLAVCVLTAGLSGGILLAVISPVMAFLLSIAPNFVTVGPIMVANTVFVLLHYFIAGSAMKYNWRQVAAVLVAAVAKFAILYFLVVRVICDFAAPQLLGQKIGETVVLAPPMLKMLPTMFTWPQLITALIGGSLAMGLLPVLQKAIRNK